MNKVISDFAEPVSPAQPGGIDVEYDARFIDMQTMVEGKPEQQYGDVIIAAEGPDWKAIEKLCCQILSETKDLRVFCFYAQSLTANYGIQGFDKGCEIIKTNIELYWEDIYPKLTDEDGDEDTFYRTNAFQILSSPQGIVRQLSESPLIKPPASQTAITVGNTISVLTGKEDDVYPGGKDRLIQDLKVMYESNKPELISIQNALGILEDIESIFNDKITDNSLDLTLIKKPLKTILSFVNLNSKQEESTASEDEPDLIGNDNYSSEPSSQLINTSGAINLHDLVIKDREDVSIILDKLIVYFRVKEPSHPAPLFIERLQKLMDMSFYEILKNISPDSMDDLEKIIGSHLENNDSDD